MSNIPTTEILSQRLCLVCAREGVRKPVQEHGVEHNHFKATLHALDGEWVEVVDDGTSELVVEAAEWREGSLVDALELLDIHDADILSYGIDVGGFVRDRDDTYYCPRSKLLTPYDTPREAILRAKMEQLWEQLEVGDDQDTRQK